MTVFTDYLWFNTKGRQEFVRITDQVGQGLPYWISAETRLPRWSYSTLP